MRDEIIAMVKAGTIEVPKSEDGRTPNVKSLNVYDLAEEGLITLEGEAPVEMPAPDEMDTYEVVSGDVLWRIAQAHGTTWEKLAEINELANPNLIFPGQELMVPAQ
jgi:2',3'-cyclic-nucleotide 2'-phosphodiesterase/3'-nucleotidase